MRALTVAAVVGEDHTLTVQVPPDITPGVRTVVIVLEDAPPSPPRKKLTLDDLPVHQVGLTDPSMTFRREDMYGDDGR